MSKLRCKLQRGCYTKATCLATMRKVEDSSTSFATRNATIAVAKWGVTRQIFLATCKCNMAFSAWDTNMFITSVCIFFFLEKSQFNFYKIKWNGNFRKSQFVTKFLGISFRSDTRRNSVLATRAVIGVVYK